jgi:coenzyme F420-reducing hydrogenase gamma subunit
MVRCMTGKPKLAVYWSASCGGCEIALANLHEHILDVATHFDFMFYRMIQRHRLFLELIRQ